MDARSIDVVRKRVLEIRRESPWMEDYEIEAVICTEFDFDAYNVSDIREMMKKDELQGGYTTISNDEIGKYGAYAPVNKGAVQRKDIATRALYDLTTQDDSAANAVLDRARVTISGNIRRETDRIGFTLLLSFVIEMIISVVLVIFTCGIMGWSVDEVYDLVTRPQSMALITSGMLLLGLAFPFIAYLFVHKLPLSEMVPLHKLRKGELMPMIWMGLAVMMLDGCLSSYLNHPGTLHGANYSYDVMSFGSTPFEAFLTFFGLGVIPALIESFVFNGVILQVLRRRGGDSFALIVSSILFALLTTNFFDMPGAFLSCMWLGYMVMFSGSLVPAVCVRLIERILFFLVTQLGFVMQDTELVSYVDCGITLLIIALGIVSVSTMLKRFPEYFVIKRSDPCLTLGKKVGIALTRWSVLLLMLYCLVSSLIQVIDLDSILTSANNYIYG